MAYKMKWVRMEFPRDLTEHQENILIANLQALREETKKELHNAWAKLNKRRFSYLEQLPGVGIALNFMRGRIALLSGGADEFYTLEKENVRTYKFGYAWDELKTINAHFSLLGKQLRLPEPSIVNEGKLLRGLKKHVFQDMGFKIPEVKITVSESNRNE